MEISIINRSSIESEQNDRKLIEEVARLFNELLMIHTLENIASEIKVCERKKPKTRLKTCWRS